MFKVFSGSDPVLRQSKDGPGAWRQGATALLQGCAANSHFEGYLRGATITPRMGHSLPTLKYPNCGGLFVSDSYHTGLLFKHPMLHPPRDATDPGAGVPIDCEGKLTEETNCAPPVPMVQQPRNEETEEAFSRRGFSVSLGASTLEQAEQGPLVEASLLQGINHAACVNVLLQVGIHDDLICTEVEFRDAFAPPPTFHAQ
ncbi:hypothetical protein B0H17DRAFT_1145324 [Mycena rosella]|uniref:Uncharacterized protein n=1 Tax=Mycena rosella TaxID=1033263 RepID=A0AAD7CR79_MYCRO|nr:hypothetical protein B0H17DRAFT_1145324 [Mycena rosella]